MKPEDEIKPDMVTKFANLTAPEVVEPEPSENIQTAPSQAQHVLPVTQEDIMAIHGMCHQLNPDGDGKPFAQRVSDALNHAYIKGHVTAAGVMPVYDKEDPSQPSGYLHPQFGFFGSDKSHKHLVDEAYEAGIDVGVQRAIANREVKISWEQRGASLWEGFKGFSAWAVLVVFGIVVAYHLPPFGGH